MTKIVIEANVLYSNTLRGLFLWLAWSKLCEIVWSQEIWDEVLRNYSGDPETLEKFKQQIHSVVFPQFSGCMKNLNKPFGSVGLPDPDDEHVVALARQQGISLIITFNKRDFPEAALTCHGVQAVHPDDFLCDLWTQVPEEFKSALQQTLRSYSTTRPSKSDYFASLKRAKVPQFAEILEEANEAENLFPEVW